MNGYFFVWMLECVGDEQQLPENVQKRKAEWGRG